MSSRSPFSNCEGVHVLFYERKIWRMLQYCISIIGMCNSFSTILVSNESYCMYRRMDCFLADFLLVIERLFYEGFANFRTSEC